MTTATARRPGVDPSPGRLRAGVRRQWTVRRRTAWIGLAYAAPALALYAFIVLIPLGQSISFSFYHWDGVSAAIPAGFDNYLDVFRQPLLRESLEHVLVLIVFFALIPTALGLVSAGLLGRARVRGRTVFRVVIFLPQVLASVVVAIVWGRVLGPDGPVNGTLRALGLGTFAVNWLGDFTWALPSLGLIGTWVSLGFCMLLFLAGVGAIPIERYESARLDGAGALREFLSVTLPSMRGYLAVALTLTVTAALRTFDLVWNTTKGGPGSATTTPALMLYRYAFRDPQIGQAAAIGVIMAILCLLVALVLVHLAERE